MTNLAELKEWIERVEESIKEASEECDLEDVKVSARELPQRITATWMDEEFIIYITPDKTKKEATRT